MPRRKTVRELGPRLGARGYVHRGELLDDGWRPDAIREAVAREGLARYGRQWIVAPDAAPELHLAASAGAVTTCVTAAKALGLWVLETPRVPHVALPPTARRAPGGAHAHWSAGVVPRPPRVLADPIENVLQIVADCLPREQALAVWDSALRGRLLTPEDLHAVDWRGARATGCRDEATAASHSGLETIFAARVRRLGTTVRQQVWIAGHRVDALLGKRVVVQIDGYAHHCDAAQRRSDIAHDRALQRLGYVVLRFDYHEIVNEWPRVEAAVRRALARGGR